MNRERSSCGQCCTAHRVCSPSSATTILTWCPLLGTAWISCHTPLGTVDSLPQESPPYGTQRSELRCRRAKCSNNTYIFRIPIVIHRLDYGAMHFLVVENLLYASGGESIRSNTVQKNYFTPQCMHQESLRCSQVASDSAQCDFFCRMLLVV